MPLVSVLMPMKNVAPFVRAAIESVLAQDGADIEILACDDGSTDDSVARVEAMGDPRVKLMTNPASGVATGLNCCLEAASGSIVMRCDADDLYPEGRVRRQVQFLEEHPEFGAVSARFQAIDRKGRRIADFETPPEAGEITDEIKNGTLRTSLCTFAVRTEFLRNIGCARPFFVTSSDLDIQYRLAEVCRIWFEPEILYLYRLHDQSIIHSRPSDLVSFYVDCTRQFQIQRQSGQPDDLERGQPPEPPEAYTQSPLTATRHEADLLVGSAWDAHARGDRGEAIRLGWRACTATPWRFAVWRSLIMLCVKRTGKPRAS